MTGKVERTDISAAAQMVDAAEEDSLAKDTTSKAIENIATQVFAKQAREDAEGGDKKSSLPSAELRAGQSLSSKYHLKLHHVLGEGSFGIVYHGVLKKDPNQEGVGVAVKVNKIKSDSLQKDWVSINSLKNEIDLLKRISEADADDTFPFTRYIASKEIEPGKLALIQTLCDCTLKIAIAKGMISAAQLITDVAKQLLKGLNFLQANRIVHCDLTPMNILVQKNEAKDCLKMRICDFGAACMQPYKPLNGGYYVQRWYRPPDMAFGLAVTTAVDRWSLGCTLFELITSRPLFPAIDSASLFSMNSELLGAITEIFFNSLPKGHRYFDTTPNEHGRHETLKIFRGSTGMLHRKLEWQSQKISKQYWQSGSDEDDQVKLALFDLVSNLVQWDPNKRLMPADLLKNPIFAIEYKSRTITAI